jgi:ABC-type transporter Mla maintaining outer membrane lipid asymmetry ATPase subunit MlaF
MTDGTQLAFEAVQLPGMHNGGLSLEIPARATAVLLGSDASGVDLLGTYALGLDVPAGGRVLVFGENIAEMRRRDALAFRRRVGYLPAGDGLLHNLSLADNVALPLRFGSDLSDRECEGRIRVVLAMLGIAAAAQLRPSQVSDEQRRRAALARALVFDPQLVILERPFSGLTAKVAAEVLELARGGLSAEGSRRTVFMTGPYIPELLRNRIEHRFRIAQGQLQADD